MDMILFYSYLTPIFFMLDLQSMDSCPNMLREKQCPLKEFVYLKVDPPLG